MAQLAPAVRVVCAWCRAPIGGNPLADTVSHGICPRCKRKFLADEAVERVKEYGKACRLGMSMDAAFERAVASIYAMVNDPKEGA